MLNKTLQDALFPVTEEEQRILGGQGFDRNLYMNQDDIIRADKMLEAGSLIAFRAHPRFAPFPLHRHDYVEMVYMCSGQTTHIINGKRLTLKEGELLLLAQHTTQEILAASEKDIAVNFIILPAFFEQVLPMVGEKDAPLRRFLVDCLYGQQNDIPYLHFKVTDVTAVQNLMENLMLSFLTPTPSRRQIRQSTMGLLFLHLLGQTEHLLPADPAQALLLTVYRYIEEHYADGTLTELSEKLHFAPAFLSRRIRELSGRTYTELVQEKRLSRAAFLLRHTTRNVDDIARAVGYDNVSYFHRLFQRQFGCSPRRHRLKVK